MLSCLMMLDSQSHAEAEFIIKLSFTARTRGEKKQRRHNIMMKHTLS
jgi:hypothetical protein